MSDTSTSTSTSATTSTTTTTTATTATGNETATLADEIKKYDAGELIEFLRKQEDLKLKESYLEILSNEEITGRAFLNMTKQDFRDINIKAGPALLLADFAKECKEKRLKAFSSYHSLKKVLAKYGIDSNGTDSIPLFELQTHEILDRDKHFGHCMEDILFRMKHYGSLVLDSLESIRNEYVSTILHTALHITEDATNKEFSMRPEFEIVGDKSENLICVTEDKVQRSILEGFAQNIKQLESSYETNKRKRKRDGDDFDYLYGILSSARDWHFLLYTPGKISQGSKLPLSIEFSEDALDKNSVEYLTLLRGLKSGNIARKRKNNHVDNSIENYV
ncbi:hypothetical protein Glove_283g75 [Diversispora epigaea]|uniref:SAM domain-containing protein n=1 Tax=Diversispora epigaea TaxID=1348612 RepID=A0A397I1Q5_9GLOM|nr:hypothetical protein Glove_283g75 [Diversispora epigaea]